MWALFKDGKQVSKPHTAQAGAVVEAYEAKVVYRASADLGGAEWVGLADGYEIKEF